MGALVNGKCFESNALAVDDFFSSKASSYTPGTTSYHSWFEKVGTVWVIKRQSISSTGVITNLTNSNATIPTFPVCDTSANFMDGLQIGWAVVLAMVMVWAFKLFQKAL